MIKKTKISKIPTQGLIFFSTISTILSFFLGTLAFKIKSNTTSIAKEPSKTQIVFAAEKSTKPELKFFVMSFCPYGNQAEEVIKPIAQLLTDKATFTPLYIFEKVSGNLTDYCKNRTGNPDLCEQYVANSNGQLKNIAECQQLISDQIKQCTNETNYLKLGNNFYSSLHGRQEATQNIREICAFNLTSDKTKWWNFIDNVNTNCTADNADSCWQAQAKSAGLDTNKITDCFNKDASSIIESQIVQTEKFQVSSSPTIMVNDIIFPPESAYTQDGTGALKIGKTVISQTKYRTPDTIKQAICASFNKTPKECKTILPEVNTAPAAAAGCN